MDLIAHLKKVLKLAITTNKKVKTETQQLKTKIQSSILSCIVCNSLDCNVLFKEVKDLEYETYKPVDYAVCRNCELIFQYPLPEAHLLPTFYPKEYRNYLPVQKNLFSFFKTIQFNNLARNITKHLNKNVSDVKILDIGFGNGQFLLALKKLGYKKLYGCDFTDTMFPVLHDKELTLKAGNIEECFPFDESFDLIIMNNVIEHFLRPESVLKRCKERLNKNGKIILITPNTNALEFSIFGKYWAGFHAPRHTFLFNSKNIESFGKNLGFSQIYIEPISDPGQWSISIQNIVQDNSLIKSKLKNGMSWYLMLLSIIVLPIVNLQNRIGKSTSMMCVIK